jgi:hypothetical protein
MTWLPQGTEEVSATFFRPIVVLDQNGEECDDEEEVTVVALVTPVRKANRRGHPDTWEDQDSGGDAAGPLTFRVGGKVVSPDSIGPEDYQRALQALAEAAPHTRY